MEYYHPKKTKNNKLLYPIDKNNKFLLDSPNEYFSYSDNDINEKYSDFEESHEIINSIKDDHLLKMIFLLLIILLR